VRRSQVILQTSNFVVAGNVSAMLIGARRSAVTGAELFGS
jgi:hypothetical protein